MGLRLEDIISKHGLQVHNDGTPTYWSGKVATAPDVTITKGFRDYGTVACGFSCSAQRLLYTETYSVC